jgi:hypothetical protein
MTDICKEWKIWREEKTEAFQYLMDYVLLRWDLNEANNYYEYRPKDIIFRDYYCAKGVYGYWEDKEVYSLSLNSYLWFDGRVYNHNFQFYQEEPDSFINNCTVKIMSNEKFSLYQDLVKCDDVFCRYEDLYQKK